MVDLVQDFGYPQGCVAMLSQKLHKWHPRDDVYLDRFECLRSQYVYFPRNDTRQANDLTRFRNAQEQRLALSRGCR